MNSDIGVINLWHVTLKFFFYHREATSKIAVYLPIELSYNSYLCPAGVIVRTWCPLRNAMPLAEYVTLNVTTAEVK